MTAITKDTIKFLELHAMEYQNKKIELANQYISDYKKYIHVLNFLNGYIHSIETISTGRILWTALPPFLL